MVCSIGLVYRPHSTMDRRKIWEELKKIKEKFGVPFLMIGDFNKILNVGERCGNANVTIGM